MMEMDQVERNGGDASSGTSTKKKTITFEIARDAFSFQPLSQVEVIKKYRLLAKRNFGESAVNKTTKIRLLKAKMSSNGILYIL